MVVIPKLSKACVLNGSNIIFIGWSLSWLGHLMLLFIHYLLLLIIAYILLIYHHLLFINHLLFVIYLLSIIIYLFIYLQNPMMTNQRFSIQPIRKGFVYSETSGSVTELVVMSCELTASWQVWTVAVCRSTAGKAGFWRSNTVSCKFGAPYFPANNVEYVCKLDLAEFENRFNIQLILNNTPARSSPPCPGRLKIVKERFKLMKHYCLLI